MWHAGSLRPSRLPPSPSSPEPLRRSRLPTSPSSPQSPTHRSSLRSSSSCPSLRGRGTPYTGSVYPPSSHRVLTFDHASGVPLCGVHAWPLPRSQTAYVSEFESTIARSILHPYNPITSFNKESVSHNLITGSAFRGTACHRSEYNRQFTSFPRLSTSNVRKTDMGLRSEEMFSVGLYTPIQRAK
ncbi:hypothetical protein AB1Y20_012026 [Prymnesium parvum]|uniref:Uncharacterized protein n=1 Tax=Prymnesium parvum TaxID=97485 RepID=A0AB34IN01_PRYPA